MADVILCRASRFLAMHQAQSKVSAALKVIQIDIDEEEIGLNWYMGLGILSDVKTGISALLGELPASVNSLWEITELQEINGTFVTKADELAPVQTDILRDIRSELNEDAILVLGITNIGYWSRYLFPVYKPRTHLSSFYFITLGHAFPTALGAKVGNPDKQVVALSGDGWFLFAVSALATAVQLELNVIVIVLTTESMGLHIGCSRAVTTKEL